MTEPRRVLALPDDPAERTELLRRREWLVTNGIGGFASGSLAFEPTRRYHGILVAALPNPLGRMAMLTELAERIRLPGGRVLLLGGSARAGEDPAADAITGFRLEAGLPVWTLAFDGAVVEKRIWMAYQQNTVFVAYRLVEGPDGVRLNLRPALNIRPVEQPVSTPVRAPLPVAIESDRIEIRGDVGEPLRLRLAGAHGAFAAQERTLEERLYPVERARGYEDTGALWSPGWFRVDLARGETVTLIASTEPWSHSIALAPEHALASELERRARLLLQVPEPLRSGAPAELVLAADTFIVTPAYRATDVARRRAAGDELRSVIAGYHWFTDWGRDTMVSLQGLTLATGRPREAGEILRTFAQYERDGLIPNMFPEGSSEGAYHTVDATLWMFHAIARYVRATGDRTTLRLLLPTLRDIVEHHLRGTLFGIRVDPADGLLTQGAEGYQLTWMDAKVDGWVVTPRRGKAVEINALWYNALRLLEEWLREEGDGAAAAALAQHAQRARDAFNARFWYAEGGWLYDVVDGEDGGDDPALRPNQLFAISLDNPVLERERWARVLEVAREHLLTPVGLRSLAPGHPDYKRTYHGDLRTRDAAYHQGTVWAWLIGPYIDAHLKVHPGDVDGARRLLDGLIAHLDDFGVGSIAEIFDAEAPFTPRGCIAQAWSVAEVLRCWVLTSTSS